eukprot:562634-Prymnesium_polylepis.1
MCIRDSNKAVRFIRIEYSPAAAPPSAMAAVRPARADDGLTALTSPARQTPDEHYTVILRFALRYRKPPQAQP